MGKNPMNLEWAIWNYFRAHLASKACFFPKALYWRKHSLAFYPLKSGIYKGSCWLSNCSSQKHHTVSSNLSQLFLYLVFSGIIYTYLNWILTQVRGKKEMKKTEKIPNMICMQFFFSPKQKGKENTFLWRYKDIHPYTTQHQIRAGARDIWNNFCSEWTLWWILWEGTTPSHTKTILHMYRALSEDRCILQTCAMFWSMWGHPSPGPPTSCPWFLPCTLAAPHPGFCLALVSRRPELGLFSARANVVKENSLLVTTVQKARNSPQWVKKESVHLFTGSRESLLFTKVTSSAP